MLLGDIARFIVHIFAHAQKVAFENAITDAARSCSSSTEAEEELHVQVYNYLAMASYSPGKATHCLGLSANQK